MPEFFGHTDLGLQPRLPLGSCFVVAESAAMTTSDRSAPTANHGMMCTGHDLALPGNATGKTP